MKNESNPLALDTNKWLKLVEEVENPNNARKWKKYLEYHNFYVILPQLVLKEIVWTLTNKNYSSNIYLKKEYYILRLMKVGCVFYFRYVKSSKNFRYYLIEAEKIIKKDGLDKILESLGLYEIEDGIKKYYLHKHDLAILMSLKELGYSYYFLTHDDKLKKALQVKEIRDALVHEGICFILIYETQSAKNRKIIRIKVLPEITL